MYVARYSFVSELWQREVNEISKFRNGSKRFRTRVLSIYFGGSLVIGCDITYIMSLPIREGCVAGSGKLGLASKQVGCGISGRWTHKKLQEVAPNRWELGNWSSKQVKMGD